MSQRPQPSLSDQVVDRGARLVAVAVGTVLGGLALGRERLRSTPTGALPGVALGGALAAVSAAKDHATGLALKGLTTIANLRGGGDSPEPTPYPEPRPVPVATPAPVPTPTPVPAPAASAPAPAEAAPAPAEATAAPAAPAEPEPSPLRDEAAATAVDAAVAGVTEPERDELPLADYDHLTLGSLRARLRGLTVEDLTILRAYETAHGNRLPIVVMFDNRIAKLSAS